MGFRAVLLTCAACLVCISATVNAGSQLELIRNNDIQTVDPVSPPLAGLFDPGTGDLLGQAYPQPYDYASHTEDLDVPGDGPLVFYMLDDPDQTLFVIADEDRLSVTSSKGTCRAVDAPDLLTLINNTSPLHAQHERVMELYGALQFPGGIHCEDPTGTLSVRSFAALYDPIPGQDNDDERLVSLVYLRDSFELPRAYVVAMTEDTYDYFNADGGFRYDRADPGNPVFQALDANGQVSIPTSISCLAAGVQYKSCLVLNQIWREEAAAEADALMAEAMLECVFEPLMLLVGIPSPPFCVTTASDAFAAQVTVHQAGQVDCVASIPPDVTCTPPTGASAECTTGAVCRIDLIDEAPFCDWGTAPCTTPGCGGAATCSNGLCNSPWEQEVCDGYDNDCDGTGPTPDGYDESWYEVACDGLDIDLCKEGIYSCSGGVQLCSDLTGDNIDVCNGSDDDCDGQIDEDFVGVTTQCGVGACATSGATTCVDGQVQDSCVPGTPIAEVCDGIDNDCDGETDAGCLSFTDDFNRQNLGSDWQTCGTVSIVSDALQVSHTRWTNCSPPEESQALLVAAGTSLRDGTVQFDLDNGGPGTANHAFGIGFGAFSVHMNQDSRNDPIVENRRRVNLIGPGGILAQVSEIIITPGRYEFSVSGSTIRFRNIAGGTAVDVQATDTTPTGPGPLLIYVNEEPAARVDNLVLTGTSSQQTGTGFHWPTGTSEIGSYAGWLAECCDWSGNCDYFDDDYHIGWDLAADEGGSVYAISDGTVVNISENGWGAGNVGVVIQHMLDDSSPFIAVYGHVHTSLQLGNPVVAGESIGTIGPWTPPHLHFGIRPGTSIAGPYGIMECPATAPITDTNGFVDPLDWIQTQSPG